ncbi:MAG: hypothetical protein KDK26_16275 [Roseivivax sp.]|nr:hypothetical protein [Roseivivax sp.]
MKRVLMGCAALIALAACEPQVPDSGAGVGFNDYDSYQAQQQREAAQAMPGAQAVTEVPLEPADSQAAAVAAAQNSGVAPLEASPGNPAPQVVTNAAGISEENDFAAVSGERSIQEDAALIAQNRANYQQVQPTDLPSRSGPSEPNVVEYALQTTHAVGTELYKRSAFSTQGRFERNCAKYLTPELAQEDFLAAGGPERDRYGLDPDGDGFACAFDPAPFRLARQAGN